MAARLSPAYVASLTRVLGMAVLVFAVGLLVAGITLLTTCQAVTLPDATVGCRYPFQGYGLASIWIASMATIVSANLLARSMQTSSTNRMEVKLRYMTSGAAAVFVTTVVYLTAFAYGLV